MDSVVTLLSLDNNKFHGVKHSLVVDNGLNFMTKIGDDCYQTECPTMEILKVYVKFLTYGDINNMVTILSLADYLAIWEVAVKYQLEELADQSQYSIRCLVNKNNADTVLAKIQELSKLDFYDGTSSILAKLVDQLVPYTIIMQLESDDTFVYTSKSAEIVPILSNLSLGQRLMRRQNELRLIIPGTSWEFSVIVQFATQTLDQNHLECLDFKMIHSILRTCAVVGYKELFCAALQCCYPEAADMATEIFNSLPCNYDYNGTNQLYYNITQRLMEQVDVLITKHIVLKSMDFGRIALPRQLLKTRLDLYLSKNNLLESSETFCETIEELRNFTNFMQDEGCFRKINDRVLLQAMMNLANTYEYEEMYIEAFERLDQILDQDKYPITFPSLFGYPLAEVIDCVWPSKSKFITLIAGNGAKVQIRKMDLEVHQHFKNIFEIFGDDINKLQLEFCTDEHTLKCFVKFIRQGEFFDSQLLDWGTIIELVRMGDFYLIDSLFEAGLGLILQNVCRAHAKVIFEYLPVHNPIISPIAEDIFKSIVENFSYVLFTSEKFLNVDVHTFHYILTLCDSSYYAKLLRHWIEYDLDNRKNDMGLIDSSHESGLFNAIKGLRDYKPIWAEVQQLNFRWPLFEKVLIEEIFLNDDKFKHFCVLNGVETESYFEMDFVKESNLVTKEVSTGNKPRKFYDRALNKNSFAVVYYGSFTTIFQIYLVGSNCLECILSVNSLPKNSQFVWKGSSLCICPDGEGLNIFDLETRDVKYTKILSIDEEESDNEYYNYVEYDVPLTLPSWEYILYQDHIFAISRDTLHFATYRDDIWQSVPIDHNFRAFAGKLLVAGDYIFFIPNDEWGTYIKPLPVCAAPEGKCKKRKCRACRTAKASKYKYKVEVMEFAIDKTIIGGHADNGTVYIFHPRSATILVENDNGDLVFQENRPLPNFGRDVNIAKTSQNEVILIILNYETSPMIYTNFNYKEWSVNPFQAAGVFPYSYEHMGFP